MNIGTAKDSGTKASPKGEVDIFEQIVQQYKLPQLPTADPVVNSEVAQLHTMIRQEMGHRQWKKQGINLSCLCFLILISYLRGNVFDKCGAGDWVAVAVFCLILGLIVLVACKLIASE